MSRYTTWARDVAVDARYQLNPAVRQVLMWLASHASETGAAWPSSKTLASETGLHEVTVRKALALIGDLRDPDTRRHLFAGVDRQFGRSTVFQFPTPPVAQDAKPVAQDYRSGRKGVAQDYRSGRKGVAQDYRGVAGGVAQGKKAVAQDYTEQVLTIELPHARDETDDDRGEPFSLHIDAGRVRGFCPECGHAWAGHLNNHGCCYRCGCQARP